MTTITYRDGIIAYDSRAVQGGLIIYDNENKKTISDDLIFFCVGAPSDIEKFLLAYTSKETPTHCDIGALVLDQGVLYYAAVDDNDGFWKHKINPKEVFAIGSGSRHAFTAMDMGASAKEAVKMAMKRDVYTGGRVRMYDMNE